MIQYTLKCDAGHSFDSWFKSSGAFDSLKAAGHVECALCGSRNVDKAIMAPSVSTARAAAQAPVPAADAPGTQTVLNAPPPQVQEMLAQMKRHVEANSDYVGDKFAKEARAMHLGEAPTRAIYGEANAAEAKSLLEDGVPVMPLPFKPTRQTN